MMDQAHKLELEAMIDRSGLGGVLDAVSEICSEKADHIRTNWQDQETADCWEGMAEKIEKVADSSRTILGS